MLYAPVGIQSIDDDDDDDEMMTVTMMIRGRERRRRTMTMMRMMVLWMLMMMIMMMILTHLRLLCKGTFWLHFLIPVTKIAVSIPLQGVEIVTLPIALLGISQEDIVFDAVSVGAILSDYQRVRVENV